MIARLLPVCLLLAATGCAPEAPAPPPADAQAAAKRMPAAVAAKEKPARKGVAVAPVPAPAAPAAPAAARRCGWLHNPTPGNWWLDDRDGQWVLASQGGRQAEGMEEMSDMSAAGWKQTNGYYGYGCACMTIVADPVSGDVKSFTSAQSKPLRICERDPALPRPE